MVWEILKALGFWGSLALGSGVVAALGWIVWSLLYDYRERLVEKLIDARKLHTYEEIKNELGKVPVEQTFWVVAIASVVFLVATLCYYQACGFILLLAIVIALVAALDKCCK